GGALHGQGGGRQRRDPRRRVAGERGRLLGSRVPRGGPGGDAARRERRGLRRDARGALRRVDAVPRVPEAGGEAGVAGARPLRHIPPDRGHLHALRPGRPRRGAGVDPVRGRVGPGRRWHRLQGPRHGTLRRRLHGGLRRDGLARRGGAQAPDRSPPPERPRLAAPGRHLLHRRHPLLPPQNTLLARPLARFRPVRQRLPLRRHRPVRAGSRDI
ncbi:MAG: FIG01964566: Predicted membrane protein, hemolysin III homolog, partial [uncultured Rubrobacteraceae bacterium]